MKYQEVVSPEDVEKVCDVGLRNLRDPLDPEGRAFDITYGGAILEQSKSPGRHSALVHWLSREQTDMLQAEWETHLFMIDDNGWLIKMKVK